MTDQPAPQPLSETELEILRLVATGATNREVARERGISEATVKKHVTNINSKLGTGNRTEAARRALELGLVTVSTPEGQSEGIDGAAARRLTAELERARRGSRRAFRAVAAAGLVLLALLIVALALDDEIRAILLEPTPTPVPTSPAVDAGPQWVSLPSLPSPRSGLALAADVDGVYAIGGADAHAVLSDTLRWDTDTLLWEERASKPTAVRDVGAVAVRGKFIVPGGCGTDGRAVAVVEAYDPQADRWLAASPLPEPVCGYALVELQGQVYLFGGRAGEDPTTASQHVWRYDSQADEWHSEGSLPLARTDLAAAVVGGEIHLLGGRDQYGRQQVSHWTFLPWSEADRWRDVGGPPLPAGRVGLVATSAARKIFAVGGGWDRRVDDGALVWEVGSDGDWQPWVDVRGATPQRGHAAALSQGQLLYVAGGEADSRLLDAFQLIQIAWTVPLPPPPAPR